MTSARGTAAGGAGGAGAGDAVGVGGRRAWWRWWPWVAILAVVVVVFAIGAPRHPGPPLTLDQRTQSVASQVRCPVCAGESVAASEAPASVAIRDKIRRELAAGIPPKQVLSDVTRPYGVGILEKPQAQGIGLLVWIVPVVVVAGAVLGLVLAFRRWGRRPVRRADPVEVGWVQAALDAGTVASGRTGTGTGPEVG
ncbi:MAG: cytochrome c-type biogenesis protein [Acidimicrobiales bacterium]